MKEKAYSRRTAILGIPVPKDEEYIWSDLELEKWQIVEGLLLAGTRGLHNCVFEDGLYLWFKEPDGTYVVQLGANGGKQAVCGAMAGSYFVSSTKLEWSALEAGNLYHLYVASRPDLRKNPFAIYPVAEKRRTDFEGRVYLATFDLRDGKTLIDNYPVGKLYVQDITKHAGDDDNPHGECQLQDSIYVRKELMLDPAAKLTVNGNAVGLGVPQLVSALSRLASTGRTAVYRFKTGGAAGTVVKADGRVDFAQVDSGLAGEAWVRYFGEDPKVPTEQDLIVYNKGDAGVPARVLVHYIDV